MRFPTLYAPGSARSRRPVRRKPASAPLTIEALEARNLLSDFTLGPLVQVSGPTSPFANSPTGQPGINYYNAEVEPWIVVDPTNPDHLVGSWQQDRWSSGGARGFVAAVSFDGGSTWQQVVIPGLTVASGGEFQGGADTWLSFAPNGELHHVCVCASFTESGKKLGHDAILASKSTDGGLTWSDPITLIENKNTSKFHDKPSITADPTDADRVYAVWSEFSGSFFVNATAQMARTTDGGQTWAPPQTIHSSQDVNGNVGHQIVVRPDGTLIDTFTEQLFTGGQLVGAEISVVRSTDHGLTWGPRITVAQLPPSFLTDPDTGQFIAIGAASLGFHDVAVDPNSGNVYAVWRDASFGAGQYGRIAFTMSTDGGLSWSVPIAINQTPNDIDPGNRQAFMPSVEVAADGAVGVTYYDFRNNTPAAGLLTDYWFIHAHPGADLTDPAGWKEELRLTDASFDLEKAPVVFGGLNLGEYQGLATAGNDFVTVFTQPHGADLASIFFRRISAGAPLRAAFAGHNYGDATLTSQQLDSLLPEALRRWLVPGADTAILHGLDLRIIDLGGTTLGLASGHTIWLDDNAAGWGWFVDPTPWDDSEFTTPGDQGEQGKMDLLTALAHELGHLLGQDHADEGVMAETLMAGTRRMPLAFTDIDWLAAADVLFSKKSRN